MKILKFMLIVFILAVIEIFIAHVIGYEFTYFEQFLLGVINGVTAFVFEEYLE